MKRSMGETELFGSIAVANCLVSLSRGPDLDHAAGDESSRSRVFKCKSCNRQFQSFQALGGHRASHKKPRPSPPEDHGAEPPLKLKTHECSVCGLGFAVGQALGGHMRRHRAAVDDHRRGQMDPTVALGLLPPPPLSAGQAGRVVKTLSSRRRVLCLDLNLTPLENDLDLGLGRPLATPPVIDCFP